MDKQKLNEQEVEKKLKNLNTKIKNKFSCVAWTTFPYNKKNLKIVENSLKKIKTEKVEYDVNYDENFIFVQLDLI